MRHAVRTLVACWLATLVCHATLLAQLPAPKGFVNDFAGVLNESSRAEMESQLRNLADTTSAEVAVVTVRSLDGMTVEDYAARLFQQWGIGKKQANNGVLILVSPSDRAMRIEVGYGLEPILPDGLAGEIIRNEFLPSFKDGDYPRGIRQGVSRVLEVVTRNEVAPAESDTGGDAPPVWFVIPFLGLFVALGSWAIGIGMKLKTYGPILWGGLFVAGPLFMSLVFGPAAMILGALAVGMFAWGYSKGASTYWAKTLRGSSKETASPDGWMMGSSGSSGSSGDGGSSGGSFGGGSSGGGGASGRW